MNFLFGYTAPSILSPYQEEIKDDNGTNIYNSSFVKRMEITQETKDKSIGYPKVNIQEIPNEFNEATNNNNDIAKQSHPVSNLDNGFYNGLSDNKKEYLYGQETYIPPSYPKHYYNTNSFSPLYLAEMKTKANDEYE